MAEESKNWQDKGGSAKGTSFEINTEIEKMGSKVADAVNAAGEAGKHKSTEISRSLEINSEGLL